VTLALQHLLALERIAFVGTNARPNTVGRDMLHTTRRSGLVIELACFDDMLTSPRDMQAGASLQSAVSITKP